MDESIDELLDALSESGIAAEDEGSLLDDLGPSPSHYHNETITTNCTTLLADISDASPSSTTTFATHSIDALVAKAGPPPLAPLPFRSHAAAPTNHLVDVDYCRIQVECITLSNDTPRISSQCHAMLKNLGKDAQLCLRYELPPLTSNPEIAAGGAEAIVVDDGNGKSQVMIAIGGVLSIYPLLDEPFSTAQAKASIAKDGRATTNRRRIKGKARIAKPSAIKTAKAVVGGGFGKEEIQLKHSNLLAIAFVTDKDVASWGGSFTIDLVCISTGDADPVRLASCRFLLDDVLFSRSLDVRMQLDLVADEVSSSSLSSCSSNAVGSLVARVTLIGGNSCAEEENRQHVTTPTNKRFPITDSPHRSDQVASPANSSAEDQPKVSVVQIFAAQQQHVNLMPSDHETQQHQTESIQPMTMIPPPSILPPASLPAPAPDHRPFDYQPTLHPSDTRVALERQLGRNNVAAHRIQTCMRKHLFRLRRQRRKKVEEEYIAEADLDVDSPPPPPPPPTSPSPSPSASPFSQPQHPGDLSGYNGAACGGGSSAEPCTRRPCDVSSLGESSPTTSSTGDIGSGPGTPSAAEGQLQLGIRLGSCKGLTELVSICQEPRLCLFESGAVVAVSYTIFTGIDELEATVYSKALPLHPTTSSFDFDSEQMVAISLDDDSRTIEYLKNGSLEMKLWILPASHSSVLQNEASFDSVKNSNENRHLATANMSLAPLLDCCRCAVGGYRQIVPWKPKGWLGGEHIGSFDVAIYRAGVKVDQLQPYSEDLLSIASAVNIPREEDKATREDNMSSSSSSASSAFPIASPTKEEAKVDVESPIADPSSVSSSRADSEASSDASGSSDTISPDDSSSCSGSSGSSDTSSAEEEVLPGDVQSLSVVMESLESVKKSLSYRFDGQCGSVNAGGSKVDGGQDTAEVYRCRKEQYDHDDSTNGTSDCSTLVTSAKPSSRGATPSDVKDEDARTTTNFVDVGTSPIDLGADNATDCKKAAQVDAMSSIVNEEAASQTDTIDETPRRRSMAERCHKSTNTIPMHSPSSSSTESSDDGDLNRSQSLADTCSTTNPQIQRDFTSSSSSTSTSTFRRRRRLFSSNNEAVDRNAVGCTINSPAMTTSWALSRARMPVEYRRNRLNQLPSSPASSLPTTRSIHLSSSSADRISSIMSQYPRSSGILLGRFLYESSSSSGSCCSSVGGEDGDSSDE